MRPHSNSVVRCLPGGTSLALTAPDGKDNQFGFDRVFGPNSAQEEVRGGAVGYGGAQSQ